MGWFKATTNGFDNYRPRIATRLILCGHYHDSPSENGIWHVLPGKTSCINVGQPETAFHYANLDFKYAAPVPSRPSKIIVPFCRLQTGFWTTAGGSKAWRNGENFLSVISARFRPANHRAAPITSFAKSKRGVIQGRMVLMSRFSESLGLPTDGQTTRSPPMKNCRNLTTRWKNPRARRLRLGFGRSRRTGRLQTDGWPSAPCFDGSPPGGICLRHHAHLAPWRQSSFRAASGDGRTLLKTRL